MARDGVAGAAGEWHGLVNSSVLLLSSRVYTVYRVEIIQNSHRVSVSIWYLLSVCHCKVGIAYCLHIIAVSDFQISYVIRRILQHAKHANKIVQR